MAPRSFWKGYLKLSLVTCPVSMMPATSDSEKVRFHTVNRATGNRVQSRYIDAETGKPVGDDDEVKGYEVEEGRYITLEDEELEAVALESTRTIDIDQFVPRESIGWIWLDKPHYLLPEDKIGEEAFSVIRDAMAATDMVGVSRVVLYRRERPMPGGVGVVDGWIASVMLAGSYWLNSYVGSSSVTVGQVPVTGAPRENPDALVADADMDMYLRKPGPSAVTLAAQQRAAGRRGVGEA